MEKYYDSDFGRVLDKPLQHAINQTIYIPEEMMDEPIQHYGVLGMKWGKRKKSGEKQAYERQKRNRADYYKVDKMDNDLLKKRIDRVRMENDYDRLTKEPITNYKKSKKNKRNKIINTTLGTVSVVGNIPIENAIKNKTVKDIVAKYRPSVAKTATSILVTKTAINAASNNGDNKKKK